MVTEAALITVSCVLFVQMGLSHAIQDKLKFRSEILSCPKCLSYWSVMAYMLLTRHGVIQSIAASFLSSYAALWLSLIYDALAKFYNSCYDAISETTDTPEDAEADATTDTASATDEVPEV